MNRFVLKHLVVVLVGWPAIVLAQATSDAVSFPLHPPITAAQEDRSPRPYTYVEPAELHLPSAEELKTYEVRGREFHIRRTPAKAYLSDTQKRQAEDEGITFGFFDRDDESLYFWGSGGGGRFSHERLVVEDCTFVIDFEPGMHPGGDFGRWDPHRAAISVNGFREVVVRNCAFVSRMTKYDPIHKVIASVMANDCLRVKVEDCYFEGLTTGWRGHVLAWGCGPTHIKNVEIAGAKQGDAYVMGGGIWVAHGEKIAWTHDGDPDKMIYPNGPLRIENVHVHDQEGKENTDGIYVQSIQPYLIRNVRVENWKGADSLIDVGFRDTFQKFDDQRLVNHGAIGVIEHCHFGNGYVKDSVGVAGGLIFRNNVMRSAWFFPYVFDGGNWYVLSNRFEDMSGVIVSGRNQQLDGWTPGEGMFVHGSKMMLYNNTFENRPRIEIPALFVNNRTTSLLQNVIESDCNIYRFSPLPKTWAIDQAIDEQYSFEQWQAMGKDVHSKLNDGSLADFTSVPVNTVKLPGGLTMAFGDQKAGLVGRVGVSDLDVLHRARSLSEAAKAAFDARFVEIEFEDMEVVDQSDGLDIEFKPSSYWSGRGTYRIEPEKDQEVIFRFFLNQRGRFKIDTLQVNAGPETPARLLLDAEVIQEQYNAASGGRVFHGIHEIATGQHTLKIQFLGPGTTRLDRLDLTVYSRTEEEAEKSLADAKRQEELAQAERDARTFKMEAEQLPVVEKTAFVGTYPASRASGKEYLLLMPKQLGQSATFELSAPSPGVYEATMRLTNQADRGKLQVSVNGRDLGTPVTIGSRMVLGALDLKAGGNAVKMTLVEGDVPVRLRIDRIDLLPLE